MATAKVKSYQGQLSLPFELGENMYIGDPFFVYDDAGSPKIAKCVSKTSGKSNYAKAYYSVACMIDTDKFVIVYRDVDNSSHGYARVGRINGDNTITWGTASRFLAASVYYIDVCSHANLAFSVSFRNAAAHTALMCATVNTTTLAITYGIEYAVGSGTCSYIQNCSPAAGKVCMAYKDSGYSNYLVSRAATIVGTVATIGTYATLDTSSTNYVGMSSPATNKVVVTYYAASKGYAVAATLSGTTITAGTRSEFNGGTVYSAYNKSPATDKIVVVYRNSLDGYKPWARCATLVGTTFTWGTAIRVVDIASYYHTIAVLDTDDILFAVSWDTAPYKCSAIKATITGTTITLGTNDIFSTSRCSYIDSIGVAADKYVVCWYDQGLFTSYALAVEGEVNTIPRCLGILEETGLNGDTKKCSILGGVTNAFTGLTIGSVYYIQDDGTVTDTASSYPIGVAYKSDEGYLSKTFQG